MRLLTKLIVIFILTFGSFYIVYDMTDNSELPKIPFELTGEANIDNYYVYGQNFNLSGTVKVDYAYEKVNLLLYNGEEIRIPLVYNEEEGEISFNISDKTNDGFLLEELNEGNYYLLLEVAINEEESKYYSLKNNTTYDDIDYYTLSKTNHKINFTSDYRYNTFFIKVTPNKNKDIYDVVIDPGHGGKDSGAYNNGYSEKNINLDVALKLKDYLKSKGVKVFLTREKDFLLNNYSIDGASSRISLINDSHAKYIISLHLNSSSSKKASGVEIYTTPNIDYTFAMSLADSITNKTEIPYSPNMTDKMYNGVYTRILTKENMKNNLEEAAEKGMEPYNIKENTPYYFMIREPGGMITNAYVDGRDPEVGINFNYNSNIGIEGYLVEMGYLTNQNDYNNLVNNTDKYVEALGEAIIKELVF